MTKWPHATGEMAARIRAHDWVATSLGPCEDWPERLKAVVELMLASPLVSTVALTAERLLLYNDAAARLYGARHPAVLGRALPDTFPDSYPAVAPFYDRVFAGESVTVEAQPLAVGTEAGDEVFDAYLAPIRASDGTVIGAYMTGLEVGGRQRADAALRESEERHRLMLELAPALLWRADPAGHAILTDGGWQTYTGQRDDEIQDFGWLDAIHPDDLPATRAAFAHAFETGEPLELKHRIRGPQGYRWHLVRHVPGRNEAGVITHWFGAAIDVHDQHVAQAGQQFLLALSDVLRPIGDPIDIMVAASEALGRYLDVGRCGYGEVDATGEFFIVARDWTDGKMASFAGRHRLVAFGPEFTAAYRAGRSVLIDDALADARAQGAEAAFEAAGGVRASLGVPLLKGGRFVAGLFAQQIPPRHWTAAEEALVQDVAERTWAAVERARAEAALRETEERLQQFGEASQDVLWIRDAETFQWQYLTPAFETIYGLDREAALRGDNMAGWLDLILPEDRDHAMQSLARVRDGEWVSFEFRIRRPSDGGIRWLRNTDFPIRDAAGKLVRIGGIGHDITALKEAERALAEIDARQRALIEGMPQLVWRAFDGGRWTWASPQWTAFTGQAEADSHDFGWLDPVHPDDRQPARDIWAGAIERGAFEAEYRLCDHARKRYRWFQTRAAPVRDAQGNIVEWLGTSTDIDDLRNLQHRQEVLVAELQHRVRNILTVVRSVFTRTVETGDDIEGIADHFRGRLDALARTQVIVTRSAERTVDLEDLIREELLSVATSDGPHATIDGPEVRLPAKVAETLGLALHELTTNALKYGALRAAGGRLNISWQVDVRYGEPPLLNLNWTEQGVPAVPIRPTREGFGRELIEEALPYRLGAETKFEFGGGGVRCSISVPLTAEDEDIVPDTEASV